MKNKTTVSISTIGFAVFTMLFGAGNISYPIKAGVLSGSHYLAGIAGFLLTGVLIPIIGLIAMMLFDGNYTTFFNRTGRIPGFFAILFCMLIIGPLIVMPRCVTVPFDMLSPFLPEIISLPVFSALFCAVTFLLTYKESGMLNLLGKYIFPVLIGSLGLIISIGLMGTHETIRQTLPAKSVFLEQLIHGFQTLDLLGALFFAFIIVRLIKSNTSQSELSSKQLAVMCLKGSMITAALMTTFYVGLMLLGVYYADLVQPTMNGAEMFRIIALHVVGQRGILLLITAVIITCLSTLTALAAVFAEYLRNEICNKSISYVQSLLIGLTVTMIISNFGLTQILNWGFPIAAAGYPIIVVITLCNIAYKLFDFQWIKLPVFITTMTIVAMSTHQYWLA